MSTPKTRLEKIIRRRGELDAEIQRIQGKLDSARESRDQARKECEDRGVDPDKIDEAIEKLETQFETEVGTLEQELAEAESALEPFAEG